MEAGKDEIELLRIERGIPRWGNELSEDTLPQEAGLDEIAVDFKKGCYVGQEVVSRIDSVGRVNQTPLWICRRFRPRRNPRSNPSFRRRPQSRPPDQRRIPS